MAKSYSQLQKQIEALQKQADQIKAKEVDGVISRIKVAIDHYRLTAQQLGFSVSPTRNAGRAKTAGVASGAKYSDGPGRTWSGRGPRPIWLREALSAGKTLQDFATGTSTGAVSKAKSKRSARIRFKDQAGNTWSGMGPKPRWFKEAIASGATPEQLAA